MKQRRGYAGVSIFGSFLKPNAQDLCFFLRLQIKFLLKKVSFFSKKPLFVTKTFSFWENLRFSNLRRVFPAFCTICTYDKWEAKSLEMRAILTRPNRGLSNSFMTVIPLYKC